MADITQLHAESADLAPVSEVDRRAELEQARRLAERYRLEFVDMDTFRIDQELFRSIPADVMLRYAFVPYRREGKALAIVVSDPSDLPMIDELAVLLATPIKVMVGPRSAIESILKKSESSTRVLEEATESFHLQLLKDDENGDENLTVERLTSDINPVIRLVDSTIYTAIQRRASDIHIETGDDAVHVKYRIDGVLQPAMRPIAKQFHSSIVSRIKVMAELDIAEKRVPQDGRIKIKMHGKPIDLRVSTLPTIFGEKVVMRILDQSNLQIDLARLGFHPSALARFLNAIESPYGMVLVTGPTGSGKSTTLYSALQKINKIHSNIMTAEDPVEYNIGGINQVNVQDEIGLSFAAALRAFLRQDPNIIMVGEIRDLDTASIATKAALTGHLVLSTLHTNDAASSINRLVDMGIEPFLVSSSCLLIIAQRLVRRLCEKCKKRTSIHPEVLRELGIMDDADSLMLMEAKGCPVCNDTGYKGRVGVYEVMEISPTLREMIVDRASNAEIKAVAIKEGMLTLRMDGLEKFKTGMTSLEEILRETANH